MKRSYSAWKYKREVIITSPSSTEGFQGKFALYWKPGMKKDFRDIRFVDKNCNAVPHFIESIVNASSCTVWLALPASETLLYMYYGNGGVSTGSNGAAVFDYFNDFLTKNFTGWTKVWGDASICSGLLCLGSTSKNCVLESTATYGYNNIVEARMYHPNANSFQFGFRSTTSLKRCTWYVDSDYNNYDETSTFNGTTGSYDNDNVNRGGTTFYIYGVAYLSGSAKFYINYVLRNTISTTVPTVTLPIQFYSQVNKGYVRVDWVRIRKYSATEPTITLGKRVTNQPKAYPYNEAINGAASIGMIGDSVFQYRMSQAASVGMKAQAMWRHPAYFRTSVVGPYRKWKMKGDIQTPFSASVNVVNLSLRWQPGMTYDGRDLRFSTVENDSLKYYIESLTDGVFSIWVEVPAFTRKINYYYGRALAVSESDVSIYSGPLAPVTTSYFYPSTRESAYLRWKYQGEINISNPDSQAVQLNISIKILPGMASDGRDLRFSEVDGTVIPYYLESISNNVITCIIKVPANTPKVYFYYGNGTAVSESDPASVFEFWEPCDTFDTGVWTKVGGGVLATGSTFRLSKSSSNTLIRSTATYAADSVLEYRGHHPSMNQVMAGFWSADNNRACWLGSYTTDAHMYAHTYNGSSQTFIDDGVDRSGSTDHIYGIEYRAAACRFFVDNTLRQTITTTLPSGSLPLSFYSELNEGDFVLDWIRVRKYTSASASVGKHYPQNRSIVIVEESINPETATVLRHYPQGAACIPYYEYIAGVGTVCMQPAEATFKERRELADYNLISCDVSKSTSDTYLSLSAQFADLTVPPEGSTVKFQAYEPDGVTYHLLFSGKALTNSPGLSSVENTISMQATDLSRNLAAQKIPWNYRSVNGDTMSWSDWIKTITAYEKTGVYPITVLDTDAESTQFSFEPSKSRLDVIKEISAYIGSIINIKLKSRTIDGFPVIRPELYCVPPEYIDQSVNGFDLPAPVTLTYPDPKLIDNPSIESDAEEKYNSVIVYGVLSDTGETTVAAAYSPRVYLGEEKAREYIYEDNSIVEKGSTAQIEAVKWLLYFLSNRVTVNLKFVNRFDFELYQRVKFGSGFSNLLQSLTNTVRPSYVVVYDPRDEEHSTNTIDVSGVPTPSWLRVSEIKYHCEPPYYNTVEIKLITDYIYSASDPVISDPYSTYLSPGYFKPVSNDLISTTESIVDDTVSAQLKPEICTVLSIDTENNQAVVQTASGKLLTVRLS